MSLAIILAFFQLSLSGLPKDLAEGCNDKGGATALSSCYSERADLWNERLRAAYAVAMRHVQGTQRDALERAQAAWLRYRNETCQFYNLDPGSIHFIQGAYCMLDLNRHRALELEEYVLP